MNFFVPGVPAPQVSKRYVGNGRMVESSKDLPAWREAVTWYALRAANPDEDLHDCPLRLDVEFRFTMPKGRRKADRERGWTHKTTKPDLDKLIRAIGDALEASGVITSDAQIVDIRAEKLELIASPKLAPGADITLTPLTYPEDT